MKGVWDERDTSTGTTLLGETLYRVNMIAKDILILCACKND